MAKPEKLFSSAFRGFDREEVVAYIDELNRATQNAAAQNEARIAELSGEIASLKQVDEQNANLRKQALENKAQLDEAAEEIERLKNDAENQRLAISAAGERALALEAEVERLKTELAAEQRKAAAMEENAKEYDSMLADVGGILSTARRKAEDLISEAGKRAEQIVGAAEQQAKAQANKLLSESDEKVAENMKKVKYLYRRQDELAELFKEHKAKVDSFFTSLQDGGENK